MSELQTLPGYSIQLTPKAARVIQEAFEAEKVDQAHAYVRVGARPGGCSGYKYALDFADAGQVDAAQDVLFESLGVKLIVERSCLTDVLGSVEIDFQDSNLIEQGFAFKRLSEGAVCGCGQSFTPIKPEAAKA